MNKNQFDEKFIDYAKYLWDFLCIIEAGSMNQASLKYCKSTNGISNNIKNLEKILDIVLFDRSNNKAAKLTEQGQEFYDYLMADEKVQAYINSVIKHTSNNHDKNNVPAVTLPKPFPCASCMWEDVAELIEDSTLTFDFLPGGIPALMPEFISLVYKFTPPVSLLPYTWMNISLSFLSGDFDQINLEFHCLDRTGENIVLPQEILIRQDPAVTTCKYHLNLKNDLALSRVKEICFVVPRSTILRSSDKTGSFRVDTVDFKK